MPEQPMCPVCGEPPSWAERIEVGSMGEFPTYVDGVLHCPNELDVHHSCELDAYRTKQENLT